MEKPFFKMMNGMTKDCLVYTHEDDIWLLNPNTKEWVISYYPKTKYVWWNYNFFRTVYDFLSMNIKDRRLIRDWVQKRMNIEIGNNCEPDMFPGEYDWSSDFNIGDVLIKGKVL